MTMHTQFEAIGSYGHLPLRERVVDELADMLFLVDTVLDSLHTEEANNILWIEPHVRRLYDEVNALLHRLSQ